MGLRWDVSDPGGTGYWYAEVERANASGWTLEPRCGVGPNAWHDGLHRHRAFGGSLVLQDTRARQRRNWEDRPASAETQTTVWVTRTVTLSVTTFLDVNANGNWDADETAPTTPVIVWRWGRRHGSLYDDVFVADHPHRHRRPTQRIVRVPDYIAAPQSVPGRCRTRPNYVRPAARPFGLLSVDRTSLL